MGVAVEKEEEYLFDKEIKCPCCSNKFNTKKVRVSRLRLEKRDEDLLNYYKGINPIKYAIIVCPSCGYASPESKFMDIRQMDIKTIKETITPRWTPRDLGGIRGENRAIETYKLALLQGNIIRCSELEMGNICLSIGWLNRIKEDKKEETRFLEMARDRFIEAYNKESLSGTNMTDAKLSYMIAELSRRIGDIEESSKWFATSIQSPTMRTDPSLNTLARDQWIIVKDMVKENRKS